MRQAALAGVVGETTGRAPLFSARSALADNEPKLIDEMFISAMS